MSNNSSEDNLIQNNIDVSLNKPKREIRNINKKSDQKDQKDYNEKNSDAYFVILFCKFSSYFLIIFYSSKNFFKKILKFVNN